MASELRLTTLANNAGTESVDTTYVINGSAKAWVNINGVGTPAARDSLNVSSIGDRGTGQYTVNNSTSFANTNFAMTSSAGHDDASGTTRTVNAFEFTTSSTKTLSFQTFGSTTQLFDTNYCFAAFHGDLA